MTEEKTNRRILARLVACEDRSDVENSSNPLQRSVQTPWITQVTNCNFSRAVGPRLAGTLRPSR